MVVLLALLLLGSPPALHAENVTLQLSVPADRAGLEAGVSSLFARAYGRWAEMTLVEEQPGIRVSVEQRGDTLLVTSTTGERSIQSTVPAGAPASLVATVTGDIAFLLFSPDAFPLAPPPRLTAVLAVDSLALLTGWTGEELEPIGLAGAADEVTLCFPHRWLTLGPSFRIAPSTVRDINAQSSAREPVQLSGIARGGETRYLLSEKQGSVVAVDPAAGTRSVVSLAGLPPLPARALAGGRLAVIGSDTGGALLTVVSTVDGTLLRARLGVPYLSAFCADAEGNLWTWDPGERRVRVFTAAGREVYAIRPLVPAAAMPLAQQLEVFADGSFLLGGSGEVWKFDNAGVPLWRLTRVPGRPAEQLPAGFVLAANSADGSFVLLDGPSRRVLSFAPAETVQDGSLGALLSRLSWRNAAELSQAAAAAQGGALSLAAWALGDRLARRGGSGEALAAARVAILGEKARQYVQVAESLAADLRYERAEKAYLGAAEAARALAAEAPDRQEAADLLQRIVSRRQELRAALARASEGPRVVSARAALRAAGGCVPLLAVTLEMRNTGAQPMTRLAIRLAVPAASPMPTQAAIDALAPGETRVVTVTLGLREGWAARPGQPLGAGLLASFTRGQEEVTASSALEIPAPAAPLDEAASLLCRAPAADPLVTGLGDDLLAAGAREPLPALAAILDGLGALRAGGPSTGTADQSARAVLRGLSPDAKAWTLFTICAASSLGFPVGVVTWSDAAVALVDTGVPMADARRALPALDRWAAVLERLYRGGSLCIPLSDGAAPAGSAAAAFRAGLDLCAARGVEAARVLWRDELGAAPAASVPVPFPLVLPVIPRAADADAMLGEAAAALSAP
jgi:hypothetical protein